MTKPKTTRAPKPEPFRQTLTSAAENIHTAEWQVTNRTLRLPGGPPWSVRQRTLHGGSQEGVQVIEVDNGALRFTVIPTRGMGILKVESGKLRLGWDSPVKEVVHPKFINLQSRGGLGWLEGFNEWLVRCGLESFGAPGPDKFRTASGGEQTLDLTLHGKIANIPASEVEVVIDRTPPFRIRVRGRVDERMLFGPQLELWTEISTEPGATSFRVEDRVRNAGGSEQEFQLLYHVNYGPPLLEAGAGFRAALKRVTPANQHSAAGLRQFDTYAAPTPGFAEQVYFMEPSADAAGLTTVMLHNAAADLGVSMTFSLREFPSFTLWKNTGALSDGYVTGLEPGTGYPKPRQVEREAGRVPRLAPGEERSFVTEFAALASREEVAAVAKAIARLQGGRGPMLAFS